jgi:spore germination protein
MNSKGYFFLGLILVLISCAKKKKQIGFISIPEQIEKKSNKEIFGFHPYFGNKNAYRNYDYKLLTSLSYFAYELNPKTGGYLSIRNWKETPVIGLAKENNCKVYLTVTNSNQKNIELFLSNPEAQEHSINTIRDLLKLRQANGVTLDFEETSAPFNQKFTNYVKNLSEQLRENQMTVNITLPAFDKAHAFDLNALNEFVDYFIVIEKNFYGKGGNIAGPVAPLNKNKLWKKGSIETSVASYLNSGLPKDKMILCLPYYGTRWETKDTLIGSKNANFLGYLSYKKIKYKFPEEPKYDEESQTAYLITSEKGKTIQVWFDDAYTLAKKYDFINRNKLAGVGIWALGYDDGYPKLWELLEEKFKEPN